MIVGGVVLIAVLGWFLFQTLFPVDPKVAESDAPGQQGRAAGSAE